MKTCDNDSDLIIYKQDIFNEDGKLNVVGTFLVLGVILACFNSAFNLLSDIIVDKDNVC